MHPISTPALCAVLTAVGALIFTTGCGRAKPAPGGKLLVAASIAPLASFARAVGGDRVDVRLLVPPGASPHVYQLDPEQMAFLSHASVLVLNGLGLEFWAAKAIDAAGNPELVVIRTADGLASLEHDDHNDHDGHHHGATNPHVWLDPIYAIQQVEAIRDAFGKADPANLDYYEANAERYIDTLRELDSEITEAVKSFETKDFVAFHPAWVYFARRYGLRQAAVIEESPGKEPSAAHIRDVVNTVRRVKARAVFAEPQFSPKAAEAVAAETGARVLFLNPLGKPPDYDYIAAMRANLGEMGKAMRR